ncbi:deoxyribose-phosphate aldolase [Alkalimonas collagenimarina]|uniref:Deoxyribose-phosphate aldolase n=1 Tax=Alkalimonas collagenimarina TaxID=400390 RepID=A0ABT9H1G8_9GAMM|nr:deoxyribose-phosphate aldolase [Alkalimonas collagenimarina]MDP4536740.1 deoxyribose-phosphate aldolase [Alkalimonas collagenimarina]
MTTAQRLTQLAQLLDVTRLQDQDNSEQMELWLDSVQQAKLSPAALCIYPIYLPLLQAKKEWLNAQAIAKATVVNFPGGQLGSDEVCQQIAKARQQGADEIDCVLPYQDLMAGKIGSVKSFLIDVRQACGTAVLKVIIESGELITAQQVARATELTIDNGADFVKSSTGKVPVGLTDEAAQIILTVIAGADRDVGFKASGGVRTIEQGLSLIEMFQRITGREADAQRMRIGASGLFQELVRMQQSAD